VLDGAMVPIVFAIIRLSTPEAGLFLLVLVVGVGFVGYGNAGRQRWRTAVAPCSRWTPVGCGPNRSHQRIRRTHIAEAFR